jgi:hypothetical protein
VYHPAKTGSYFSPLGRIAVTPVRTGLFPTINLPCPEMRVTCPSLTPLTSVIAFKSPGVPSRRIPNSRALISCPLIFNAVAENVIMRNIVFILMHLLVAGKMELSIQSNNGLYIKGRYKIIKY